MYPIPPPLPPPMQVSGSSAKLTKNSAYHHFTLLLNANRDNLHSCLRPHPNLRPSRSIATPSERSEVVNLCTLHPEMTHEAVISAIAEKFYAVHRIQENKKVCYIVLLSLLHPSLFLSSLLPPPSLPPSPSSYPPSSLLLSSLLPPPILPPPSSYPLSLPLLSPSLPPPSPSLIRWWMWTQHLINVSLVFTKCNPN